MLGDVPGYANHADDSSFSIPAEISHGLHDRSLPPRRISSSKIAEAPDAITSRSRRIFVSAISAGNTSVSSLPRKSSGTFPASLAPEGLIAKYRPAQSFRKTESEVFSNTVRKWLHADAPIFSRVSFCNIEECAHCAPHLVGFTFEGHRIAQEIERSPIFEDDRKLRVDDRLSSGRRHLEREFSFDSSRPVSCEADRVGSLR